MASLVSSERAFSSAGITISKCQNQLLGDIIKALQFLKCLLRQDLIFHELQNSSVLKEEYEEVLANDSDLNWEDKDSMMGLDELFISVESDKGDCKVELNQIQQEVLKGAR